MPAGDRVARADFRLLAVSRYGNGRWPARTGEQRAPFGELRHLGAAREWSETSRDGRQPGTQRSSPSVYGWAGWSNRSKTVAVSITLPGVHHYHPVTVAGHYAQVVGDQDGAKLERDKVVEELQDLGLDRDVERRRRFVRDQDVWLACHGQGDYHALALPAAQAVGVLPHTCRRVGDAHGAEARSIVRVGPDPC